MKRRNVLIAVMAALVLGAASPVWAEEGVGNDNAIDNMGDWMSTLGKSGMEKDAILAQRKANRAAKRAQQAAKKQAKQAEKGLKNAGKGLKKGLGDLGQ